ncbi:GNAT family N-acetyltransferase [Microlunatus sp. Gsoil 973]|nr:GNAT family N-acetyltransferase [Microlunatus sp. Gsoil 973]
MLAREEAGSRYTASLGGTVVGLIDYSERPGAVVFLHTETDPAYQGRGFAGRLTAYALDDVRSRGLSVVPLCGYTQRFLVEHPDYADLLAEPGH